MIHSRERTSTRKNLKEFPEIDKWETNYISQTVVNTWKPMKVNTNVDPMVHVIARCFGGREGWTGLSLLDNHSSAISNSLKWRWWRKKVVMDEMNRYEFSAEPFLIVDRHFLDSVCNEFHLELSLHSSMILFCGSEKRTHFWLLWRGWHRETAYSNGFPKRSHSSLYPLSHQPWRRSEEV